MMSYRTWGRGLCLLVALAALPVIGQEPREEGTEAGRDEGAKQERPEKPDDQTGTRRLLRRSGHTTLVGTTVWCPVSTTDLRRTILPVLAPGRRRGPAWRT